MMQYEHCAGEVEQFIRYLKMERRLSAHSARAYQSDLNQFLDFWKKILQNDEPLMSFRAVIERFLISLFHKKVSNNTIARKFSSFSAFINFLKTKNVRI